MLQLLPTLVLLVFGSDWGHVATALGFTVISSVAAGLAALLLLERADRLGDIGACAFLIVSIASFSTGLAFLAGVAISVLMGPNRRARAWIFVVPLALYAAWFIWAQSAQLPSQQVQLASQQAEISSLLLVPAYAFNSLAAVLASLTGLNYDFSYQSPPQISLGPGPALAVGTLFLFARYLKRGKLSRDVWVAIAIVLTYWTMGALVSDLFRVPTKTRYLYPGSVMVLLVATAAVSGIRISRRGLIVLFAVAAVSLVTNIALLRNGAAWFRDQYSAPVRAQFTMLDLARGRVDPQFNPVVEVPDAAPAITPAGRYLAVTARYGGSPGFTLPELAQQPEEIRVRADRILASALSIRLVTPSAPGGRCQSVPSIGGVIPLQLPSQGGTLHLRSPVGGSVTLGRFSESAAVDLGRLVPDVPARLHVPGDESPTPWHLLVSTPVPIELCGDDATLAASR